MRDSSDEGTHPSVGTISDIAFFKYVKWIPIAATVIFAGTCIIPFITSLVSGRKFPLTIPTVSESAREFPGSRIFNIGSTIAGLLIAIVGWIMTDLPSLYTTPLPENRSEHISSILPNYWDRISCQHNGVGCRLRKLG